MVSKDAVRSKLLDTLWVIVSLSVLLSISFYSYQYLSLPIDFDISTPDWRVVRVDSDAQGGLKTLEVNDRLCRIGSINYDRYLNDRTIDIFQDFRRQDLVSIKLIRNGEEIDRIVSRREGGPRPRELMIVLASFIFWSIGSIAIVFLRPRDERWLVLVLCFYATSMWIAAGAVSYTQVAYSSYVFHAFIWIFMSLFVHIHCVLPEPLLGRWCRPLLVGTYALAVVFALLELFDYVDRSAFFPALIFVIVCSLVLLVYRVARAATPASKLANRLMLFGVMVGLGPLFFYSFFVLRYVTEIYRFLILGLVILMLSLWPFSYVYAIYKHNIGALRYRANRLLGTLAFFALFAISYVVALAVVSRLVTEEQELLVMGLAISLVSVVAAPLFRARFQWLVDRYVFGIKYSASEVVGVFAERIPTAYNRRILTKVIVEEILPTLMVRESALCLLKPGIETLYEKRASGSKLTFTDQLAENALARARVFIPVGQEIEGLEWVRLVVPLSMQDEAVGVWLLGSRDPDDYYPDDDVELFVKLSNQMVAVIENFRLVEMARQEVEENERLQRQLLHSQKMEAIGRFSAGIAHDFNNLLSVIIGYGSLLIERYGDDKKLRRGLQEMHGAGKRAADLTRQLLAFSRRSEVEAKVVNINLVVKEVTQMLRRMTGEDVRLVSKLAPDLDNVHVDPGQMSQVIMNLTVNARDAMPQGGRLTIETFNYRYEESVEAPHPDLVPGDYVVMKVADTGAGFDPEIRARIFEPFFTTKDEGEGTGLGLSIVYGFVQRNDGCIAVDSTKGVGTTFTIYLPAVEEEETLTIDETGEWDTAALLGDETILVVEDEDSVRAIVFDILKSKGYDILQANGPGAALDLAERYEGEIDLLLTDVVMPHMKGPELVKRLVKRRPGLKVIYMSGYNEEAVFETAAGQEEVVLVQKPFSPAKLARVVRDVLNGG